MKKKYSLLIIFCIIQFNTIRIFCSGQSEYDYTSFPIVNKFIKNFKLQYDKTISSPSFFSFAPAYIMLKISYSELDLMNWKQIFIANRYLSQEILKDIFGFNISNKFLNKLIFSYKFFLFFIKNNNTFRLEGNPTFDNYIFIINACFKIVKDDIIQYIRDKFLPESTNDEKFFINKIINILNDFENLFMIFLYQNIDQFPLQLNIFTEAKKNLNKNIVILLTNMLSNKMIKFFDVYKSSLNAGIDLFFSQLKKALFESSPNTPAYQLITYQKKEDVNIQNMIMKIRNDFIQKLNINKIIIDNYIEFFKNKYYINNNSFSIEIENNYLLKITDLLLIFQFYDKSDIFNIDITFWGDEKNCLLRSYIFEYLIFFINECKIIIPIDGLKLEIKKEIINGIKKINDNGFLLFLKKLSIVTVQKNKYDFNREDLFWIKELYSNYDNIINNLFQNYSIQYFSLKENDENIKKNNRINLLTNNFQILRKIDDNDIDDADNMDNDDINSNDMDNNEILEQIKNTINSNNQDNRLLINMESIVIEDSNNGPMEDSNNQKKISFINSCNVTRGNSNNQDNRLLINRESIVIEDSNNSPMEDSNNQKNISFINSCNVTRGNSNNQDNRLLINMESIVIEDSNNGPMEDSNNQKNISFINNRNVTRGNSNNQDNRLLINRESIVIENSNNGPMVNNNSTNNKTNIFNNINKKLMAVSAFIFNSFLYKSFNKNKNKINNCKNKNKINNSKQEKYDGNIKKISKKIRIDKKK